MAPQSSAIAALTSSVSSLRVKPIMRWAPLAISTHVAATYFHSSGVQVSWERAIQAHLEKLTPDQRDIMRRKTQPEELAQWLADLYATGKSKKTTKLLDFLNRFTTPLQEFQSAIDIVAQINAGIG